MKNSFKEVEIEDTDDLVAVISDIHGNMCAFEATLAAIRELGIERIICLGDLVGYGYDSKAVVQLSMELGFECLSGNHEKMLLRQGDKLEKYNMVGLLESLSEDEISYLESLPERFLIPGKSMVFSHALPHTEAGYLYANSDFTILNDMDYKVIFLGHTHYPQYTTYFDRRIINPGTVGQPRGGYAGACFLICKLDLSVLNFQRLPEVSFSSCV